MGRLAQERQGRTGAKPNSDQVLAAFDRLGAAIPDKQQSLAATYGANYCAGGYTIERSLALDVCEYGDQPAAEAGRSLSKQILVRVTNREVWVNKTATLAIVQLKPDAATTALKKKLVDAFLAM
jgi:hypothetical protein